MKYALFSDLHADKTGLELLMKHEEFLVADRRICLGDVINAHELESAAEYYQKVRAVCDDLLMGNHEAVLVSRCEPTLFNMKVQGAIRDSKTYLETHNPDFLKQLSALPLTLAFGLAQATHASFNPRDPWRHVRYIENIIAEAAYLPAQINFLAHGHIPFIAWQADGLWYYQRQIYGQAFMISEDTSYVINTGSILGSREMRHYEKTFLTYDDEAAEVIFYNLESI